MEYDTKIIQNSGFPKYIVHSLKKKHTFKKKKQKFPVTETYIEQQNSMNWVTFTYYSSLVRKVTNLFKNTNLHVAFRTTNTINQQLTEKLRNTNRIGIYQLKRNTCNKAFVGQSGRPLTVRHWKNFM